MGQAVFLDNVSIASTVEIVQKNLTKFGIPAKEVLRHGLVAEEILLEWQATFGTSATFDVQIRKRFSKVYLELTCVGVACNPLPQPDDQEFLLDAFSSNLLLKLSAKTQYTYENGVNRVLVTLSPPRKDNSTHMLLWHIVAAVILGIALKFAPGSVADFAIKEVVNPLATTFNSFLSAIMTFVVFFSIAASIVNLDSVRDFTSFAGKIIKKFFVINIVCATLTTIVALFIFPVQIAAYSQGEPVFGVIRDLVLQFIPANLVLAFVDKNIPQVIFIAIICSSIILVFNEALYSLKKTILDCNMLFLKLLGVLIHFLPMFVALCILQCFSQDFSNMLGIVVIAALFKVVMLTVYGVFLWVIAVLRSGRSISQTFKQSLPIYVVAFCTMSSASVFPMQTVFCRDVLKLPQRIYEFGLPMGLVFSRVAGPTYLVILVLTCMCISDISITWQALLLLIIQVVILDIAAPPVAGGSLLIVAILFKQFGIPMEFMGIAAVLLFTSEGIGAVASGMNLQAVLMDMARETEHDTAP